MTARNTNARNTRKAQAAQPEVIEHDPVIKPTVTEEPTKAQAAFADFMASFQTYAEAAGVPSGRRVIVALAASFITGGVIGYLTSELISYLVVGAIFMTGSAFLGMLICVLGTVLSLNVAWMAGGSVAQYVLTKKADEHARIAKDKIVGGINYVRGFFKAATSDESVVGAV